MKGKSNIAIIIPGGIGTGRNNIGVPVLERIIKLLSADFNLTVFQLYKVNENFTVNGFELIDTYSPNRVMKSLKFIFTFWKIHRQRRFHIVHGFWALPCGFLAVLLGKIFRIKSLISLQGGDAISLPDIKYGQLQRWLPRKLILWALHQTDELISPTHFLINSLQNFGLNRKNIRFIPLGIDVAVFKFKERHISYPVQFLHIANLSEVKDQTTLLKAFQIMSNQIKCSLTIIGEGVLEAQVKSLADSLNVKAKIIFCEPILYESLPAYYYQADILLLTSLSEGHPIVAEEAMSSGVLLCGTNVGLLYDLPDCCIAVPVRDHDSLAREVLQVIKDPIRMNQIKKNAAEWAKAHSMHWTVEKISELYDLSSNS